MSEADRKAIEKVKQFFGCSHLDAIYYLMPDKFADEESITDLAIVESLSADPARARCSTKTAVHTQPVA